MAARNEEGQPAHSRLAQRCRPSAALRRWFGHDPARWDEFRRRYSAELADRREALTPLLDAARLGPITLVYAARDEQHNAAVVLREVLEERLRESPAAASGEPRR